MKRIYYIVLAALLSTGSLFGQDHQQAFRYSQNYISGTARYTAMGGAFGAVGGDFTAVSENPAGLGLFRTSEFTITPVYHINKVGTSLLGEKNTEHTYKLGLGNMGFVTNLSGRNSNIGLVLGFGYNALNNFNSTIVMSGISPESSLLDNFTWYANNYSGLEPLYEGLAGNLGLIYTDDDPGGNYSNDFADAGVYEQEVFRVAERSGFIGEYAFSGAVNVNHRLFIGTTLGVHAVRYYEDVEHTETDVTNATPVLQSFQFSEYNSTVGAGFAFKLGVILKPIHSLRLGATFHAPVVYSLTDEKYSEMFSFWDGDSGFADDSDAAGPYGKDYTLRTPLKASASAAFVIGKLGLVSAEYEFMDYSTADLDSPGYSFGMENQEISQAYRAVHNIKAGAELRLNPLYLRAGAQYYMNPNQITSYGSDIWVYSGGIGFRSGPTYLDIAYSMSTSSESYLLYFYNNDFGNGDLTSSNEYNNSRLSVTLGYRF